MCIEKPLADFFAVSALCIDNPRSAPRSAIVVTASLRRLLPNGYKYTLALAKRSQRDFYGFEP
jgi:hypothetical protein